MNLFLQILKLAAGAALLRQVWRRLRDHQMVRRRATASPDAGDAPVSRAELQRVFARELGYRAAGPH